MLSLIRRLFRHPLWRQTGASVAIILALASVPMIFLTGAGINYGMAAYRHSRLDAFADAAALAAVTPTMMTQSTEIATTTATNTFNAQAQSLAGVTYNPIDLAVTVTTNGNERTVTVSYNAESQDNFPDIFGGDTIALSGNSSATAGQAPNIDFYLLLDSSPSMAIAATQAGINTMVSNTSAQGGCAFGCHQEDPAADNLGNPNGEDNYALAQNLGITLRIDLLREAAENLTTTAQATEAKYNAAYRMAVYTFDIGLNTIGSLTSDLSTVNAEAANIQQLQVYSNNWLTQYNDNDDEDTDYDTAMNGINAIMPNPGSGTTLPGDTPQEVLFFVTDGVEDEDVNGGRQMSVINTDLCSAIKNRGIRIAVLYTEYLPLPTNSFYNDNIAPFQSTIGPTLEACASPGLYFEVKTGGDISAAMAALFQLAVQSAYLSR
ncbi:MAG: pilus assembly protein TadG-related protein [Acetobacteraceae bacterium]